MLLGFLSSGADLLRRTFISEPPPRSPRHSRRPKPALSRSERKVSFIVVISMLFPNRYILVQRESPQRLFFIEALLI